MSVENCFKKIRDYMKEAGLDKKISDDRVKMMARQLEALQADTMTPTEFEAKAEELLQAEQKRWAAKKAAENMMTISKREGALSSILQNISRWTELAKTQAGGVPDGMSIAAMRSWILGGALRPGLESNLDVREMARSIEGKLKSVLNEAIKTVRTAAESGRLDRNMLQELYALDNGLPEGQSGNNDALEYAKAAKALRDKVFEMTQANNPWMERAQDYLIKQMHDQARIQAAGKDAWVQFMMERYSKNSFFAATLEEKFKKFGEVYDRIAGGKWGSVRDDSASDKYMTVRGDGGNLMRQMAKNRVLIPDDWQAFADYQAQFGPKTVFEGLDKVIRGASQKIAELQKFGPNSKGMYEGLYMRLVPKIEAQFGTAEADRFISFKPEFDKLFDSVTGAQDAPATRMRSKIGQGLMMGQYLARAGFSMIRALPDLRLSASLVRDVNGRNLFTNAAELAMEYARGMKDQSYANERLADLELFSKALWADHMRQLGSPDAQPGKIGEMARKIGTLNFLNRHVDAMRSAIATVLSKHLAEQAETPWEKLDQRWQQGLQRYGISAPEWEVMRQAQEEAMGRKLITPEAIQNLPREKIIDYLKASGQIHEDTSVVSNSMVDWGKNQLDMKLGTMLNEHANLGSAHAGSRQRYWMFGDSNINQDKGLFWRMVTQFKTAGLVSYDVTRRSYFSGTGPKGDMAGLAQNVVAGMFFWTLGEYAAQLARGKTPENPATAQFAVKMLGGSAAAGLVGDMFANELSSTGGDWKSKALHAGLSLAGPVPSMALEGASLGAQGLAQAMGAKKDRHLGSDTAQFVLSNLPIGVNNLFYTRAAWDYYFTNQLKNFMGPGYLNHLEQQTRATPGLLGHHQEYLFARPKGEHVWSGKLTGER